LRLPFVAFPLLRVGSVSVHVYTFTRCVTPPCWLHDYRLHVLLAFCTFFVPFVRFVTVHVGFLPLVTFTALRCLPFTVVCSTFTFTVAHYVCYDYVRYVYVYVDYRSCSLGYVRYVPLYVHFLFRYGLFWFFSLLLQLRLRLPVSCPYLPFSHVCSFTFILLQVICCCCSFFVVRSTRFYVYLFSRLRSF